MEINKKMKVFVATILLCVVSTTFLSVVFSQTATDNLLLEPSVETISHWTNGITSGMIATLEHSSDAHTGSRALKISATYNPSANDLQSAYWFQTIYSGFVGGETYCYRVFYKSNVPARILVLAYYGSSGDKDVFVEYLDPSSSWTQSNWLNFTTRSDTS